MVTATLENYAKYGEVEFYVLHVYLFDVSIITEESNITER